MRRYKKYFYNLLRASEKYTKTDMVYLAKNASWLSTGQVVSVITSFLFAIVAANLLPKEVYGSYRFILSTAAILAIPTLAGINIAVTRAVARGHEGSLSQGTRARLRWGLLATIAALSFGGYYFLQGNIELALAMLVVAIFMPTMESFSTYSAFLRGKKEFGVLTCYDITSQIIAYGILIGTIFLTDNLIIILLAYFIPWTLLRGIFFLFTKKKFVANATTRSNTSALGKHFTIMNVVGVIANNIDKVLLWHFLGATDVAVYSIAVAVPDQINGLFKSVGSIALPKFMQRPLQEIRAHLFGKMLRFGMIAVIVVGLYVLAAPLVFRIFFPQYIEAVFFSQIIAISAVAMIKVGPVNALYAHAPKKTLYQFTVTTNILRLISTTALIVTLGMLGAVIAFVLNRFIDLILASIFLYRSKQPSE